MTDARAPKSTVSLSPAAIGTAALSFALTLALAGSMQLHAQGISSHNTRAPVSVDAGRIDVQERENRVAFSGDVVVTQSDLTVRAQRMLLNYVDAQSLELQRITATGGVTVSRGRERATGNTAVYDFNRRIITMAGDVRLRQGENTLVGGRLVIDLDTGLSSVDGRASSSAGAGTPGSQGRVRGTFTVPQGSDDAIEN
ncbi:MAG: LptA/OstA family protein [Pseudomonadota bacterium]